MSNHSYVRLKHKGQDIVEAVGIFIENCVYGRQSWCETPSPFEKSGPGEERSPE